jgi:3-hydroxyacyl-[acyl-carrier-protein] dehydratase
MRFSLIDSVVALEPNDRITATKTLAVTEEYLADHFPGFPVMPGVLMVEAMTQAAAWLIRVSEEFANSLVVLRRARNVKYGRFVRPGQTLTLTARITGQAGRETTVKARGTVNGQLSVSATLVLARYSLADEDPRLAEIDRSIVDEMSKAFAAIYQPRKAVLEPLSK